MNEPAADFATQPDVNTLWGALLIEELVRQGVAHFVVAPGSRSTPLVVAAARHAHARCHLCTDERAAAFLALGIARASGFPAAVVTTSGTAVANLLPAVVEASADRVPLLLLTADRPAELRDCGANQTVRQTGLLAGELRWQAELPAPDDRLRARLVLSTAAHAVARARGEAGPVQLNCAFREPLEPRPRPWDRSCLEGTAAWQRGRAPFCAFAPPLPALDSADLDAHARALAAAPSGIVVAGGAPSAGAAALAAALGWPLWADVRSGLRFGHDDAWHLPFADALLAAGAFAPAAAVQLGGRPTSKSLQSHLDGAALAPFVVVDAGPDRLDPAHRATARVRAEPDGWCRAVAARIPAERAAARGALEDLVAADRRVDAAVENALARAGELSEPFVARWLSRHAPRGHALFVSSSLPIRDLQRFGARDGPLLRVAANRGASGIDGVVASAAGFAVGGGAPVTLLIGDQALLHDLGSLALLARQPEPVIAVVLNNGGGSIFSLLPIAAHTDVLSPWFDAAHEVTFAGVARDFGIAYAAVAHRDDFAQRYRAALAHDGPTLIEVRSSLASSRRHHEELDAAIGAALCR